MRTLIAKLERLSARSFVELVGLVAGLLKGMPQILVGSFSGQVSAIAFGGFWVILGAAAILL